MTGRMSHRLEYGAEVRRASAITRPDEAGNVLLRFLEGVPYEVVRFGAPAEHRETSLEGAVFVQETLTFPSFVSVSLGAHASYARGRAGAGPSAIDWLHVAPRLGFVFPFRGPDELHLRLFAGRYYHSLPLSWLAYRESGRAGRARLRMGRRERRRALRRRRDRALSCAAKALPIAAIDPSHQEASHRRAFGRVHAHDREVFPSA